MKSIRYMVIPIIITSFLLTGCAVGSVNTTSQPNADPYTANNWTYVPSKDFYQGGTKYEVYFSCFGTTAGFIGIGMYRDLTPVGLWDIPNSPDCVQ
jgi:hypothetical protein